MFVSGKEIEHNLSDTLLYTHTENTPITNIDLTDSPRYISEHSSVETPSSTRGSYALSCVQTEQKQKFSFMFAV